MLDTLKAYNYWLLSQGNTEEFNKWLENNKDKIDKFAYWMNNNSIQINDFNKFLIRSLDRD